MSESPPIESVESERPFLQRVRKPLALILLLAIIVVGGWEGFRYAKLHLSLARGEREASKRQFMRAEFWTNLALGVDEKNVEATRLMAEINEAQDRPAALGWRIKVVQRAPGSTGDIMAWAKCAFRFGNTEMAVNALKSLPEDFKNRSAEYNALMAGCALANHEPGLADAYFVRAAELDRDNPVYRVNVAAFRLTNSLTKEVRAAAAQDLEGVLSDSRVSLFAARALLYDAVRSGDRARAQRFAEKLRSLPGHDLSDDLSCLEAVKSEPPFQPALEEIERRAQSNPLWTNETAEWLNSHGMAAETLRWFAKTPEAIQSNPRVQMTIADAYLATSDWNGLQTFLEKCHWDDGDFLKRAMLIRCKRELSEPWEKDWKELVAEVDAKPPEGLLLAQLVIGWKWRNETLNLLWGAATKPRTESVALDYLWGLYSQTKETGELWRVAKAQTALDPSNRTKKNNEAFLSLLLGGSSERAERLAREVSITNPKVPEWAATYAYALHLAGKDTEAKKVMENLSPEALGRPGIALYYAIVLAGNHDYAHARESLTKLNPNGMLPEERKLAEDLAQKLNALGGATPGAGDPPSAANDEQIARSSAVATPPRESPPPNP